MKIKEKKDLRAKAEKELRDLLKEKKEKLSSLIIEHSQNKLKNTREISVLRDDMARILTFLKEKSISKAEIANEGEKAE